MILLFLHSLKVVSERCKFLFVIRRLPSEEFSESVSVAMIFHDTWTIAVLICGYRSCIPHAIQHTIYIVPHTTVVSHIYTYDRAKTLSFILLIRRKSTEFENESNV